MDPFYSYSFGNYRDDIRKYPTYNCQIDTNGVRADDNRWRNIWQLIFKKEDK